MTYFTEKWDWFSISNQIGTPRCPTSPEAPWCDQCCSTEQNSKSLDTYQSQYAMTCFPREMRLVFNFKQIGSIKLAPRGARASPETPMVWPVLYGWAKLKISRYIPEPIWSKWHFFREKWGWSSISSKLARSNWHPEVPEPAPRPLT